MNKNLNESIDWINQKAETIHSESVTRARQHQSMLTKPPGSLGQLEEIAVRFSGWQNKLKPNLDSIKIRVFAGDHGICNQNISAFPQVVTTQMIQNFVDGGAAISVLSRQLNADFQVVNMGVAHPLIQSKDVLDFSVGPGTNDFSVSPAMSREQLYQAINGGAESLGSLEGVSIFIAGEMGIGNTSSASAIYAALLEMEAIKLVGPGTGLDEKGVTHKVNVIQSALDLHQNHVKTPIDVLQIYGGFEIAAMVGSYIKCAQVGVPVLVDGFISTAAALLAYKINPSIKDWLLFSHESAEPAHKLALECFSAEPLLNLGMRLGEGSGAAVACSLIQSALNLHAHMATFDDAGVSN